MISCVLFSMDRAGRGGQGGEKGERGGDVGCRVVSGSRGELGSRRIRSSCRSHRFLGHQRIHPPTFKHRQLA